MNAFEELSLMRSLYHKKALELQELAHNFKEALRMLARRESEGRSFVSLDLVNSEFQKVDSYITDFQKESFGHLQNHFSRTPKDIVELIFHFLPIESAAQLSLVCKQFNSAINRDQFWMDHCLDWWNGHQFHQSFGDFKVVQREAETFDGTLTWKWFGKSIAKLGNLSWFLTEEKDYLSFGVLNESHELNGLGVQLFEKQISVGPFSDDELFGRAMWYNMKALFESYFDPY